MDSRDIELVSLLRKAAALVRASSDVHSDHFTTAVSFAQAIERLIADIQAQDGGVFPRVRAWVARKVAKHTWSAPTADLDDYVGKQAGPEFCEAIHAML